MMLSNTIAGVLLTLVPLELANIVENGVFVNLSNSQHHHSSERAEG